jgi:hypothetical protein
MTANVVNQLVAPGQQLVHLGQVGGWDLERLAVCYP